MFILCVLRALRCALRVVCCCCVCVFPVLLGVSNVLWCVLDVLCGLLCVFSIHVLYVVRDRVLWLCVVCCMLCVVRCVLCRVFCVVRCVRFVVRCVSCVLHVMWCACRLTCALCVVCFV